MTPEELWSRYARIWSSKADVRERELEVCFAAEPVYCDPNIMLKGRKALSDYMASFQTGMPGCAFQIQSVKSHHDRSLTFWRLIDSSGQEMNSGVSSALHYADGRFVNIAGFFELPDEKKDET